MSRRGLSMGEVLVSMGLFSLLTVALFMVLRSGTAAWMTVDSKYEAQTTLRRAASALLADLEQAPKASVGTLRVGVGDGYALWFQRPLTPDSQGRLVPARDSSGSLYGVDTVLYYAIRPNRHAEVAHGYECGVEGGDDGASNPLTGDRQCPHKFLIRKVIKASAPLSAGAIGAWFTRPDGRNLSDMNSETDVDTTFQPPRSFGEVLTFWAAYDPTEGRVSVRLAGFRTREAEKVLRVGGSPMDATPFQVVQNLVVFPEN